MQKKTVKQVANQLDGMIELKSRKKKNIIIIITDNFQQSKRCFLQETQKQQFFNFLKYSSLSNKIRII